MRVCTREPSSTVARFTVDTYARLTTVPPSVHSSPSLPRQTYRTNTAHENFTRPSTRRGTGSDTPQERCWYSLAAGSTWVVGMMGGRNLGRGRESRGWALTAETGLSGPHLVRGYGCVRACARAYFGTFRGRAGLPGGCSSAFAFSRQHTP